MSRVREVRSFLIITESSSEHFKVDYRMVQCPHVLNRNLSVALFLAGFVDHSIELFINVGTA